MPFQKIWVVSLVELQLLLIQRIGFMKFMSVSLNTGIIGFATAIEGENSKEIESSQLVKIPQNSLNYLSIAVAIFNAEQHLVYFNDAYKSLWEFDDEFLNGKPTDSEILNTLRVRRKLPEQTDFRDWRNDILTSYLTTEVRDFYWYLPDSRDTSSICNPAGKWWCHIFL